MAGGLCSLVAGAVIKIPVLAYNDDKLQREGHQVNLQGAMYSNHKLCVKQIYQIS